MHAPGPFRIAFVPGVTLRKWTTRWGERHADVPLEVLPVAASGDAIRLLRDDQAEMAFVRLPVEPEGLHVIRLYGEQPVVVVSRDDQLADEESVTLDRLEDAVHDPAVAKDAVELVAAGVGRVLLPHSIARLHARKDVVAVSVSDAPETEIALVWRVDRTTTETDEFVGIVRGRTAQSSRGTSSATTSTPQQKPRRAASTAQARQRKQQPSRTRRRQGR